MKQTIEIEVPDGKKTIWKDNKIERKINEIFKFNDIKLKVIKGSCKDCYFYNSGHCNADEEQYEILLGHCCDSCRQDNNSIIFVEVK